MIAGKYVLAFVMAIFAPSAMWLGAGQPIPQPADPNVKTPPVERDLRPVERVDKIDEKMFPDGVAHDFGKVQTGTPVYHTFRIVNTSKVPIHIASIRISMNRGARAWSSKDVLQPNEEGKVEVAWDTRRFHGTATQTIFLMLDKPKVTEHRLWIQASSCENLAFFPDTLDFGKIKQGDAPTKNMIVAVPDQPKLQVTGATSDSKFIQVKVQELGRGTTRAVYQVSATVLADMPVGKLGTVVELSTNNPAMPKLFVPIRGAVE